MKMSPSLISLSKLDGEVYLKIWSCAVRKEESALVSQTDKKNQYSSGL